MSIDIRQGAVIAGGLLLNTALLLPAVLLTGHYGHVSSWLLIGCVSAFYLAESTAAAPENMQKQANRLALATGMTLLVLFWIALATGRRLEAASISMLAVGATLMLAGTLLRWLAIRRLAAFFISEARVLPDQPLATDGVYRFVRHPSETGLLAIGLGAAVMCCSLWAGIVWLTVLVPLVLVRVRMEERVLLAGFGEKYRHYMQTTGALLPKLAVGWTSSPSAFEVHLFGNDPIRLVRMVKEVEPLEVGRPKFQDPIQFTGW